MNVAIHIKLDEPARVGQSILLYCEVNEMLMFFCNNVISEQLRQTIIPSVLHIDRYNPYTSLMIKGIGHTFIVSLNQSEVETEFG